MFAAISKVITQMGYDFDKSLMLSTIIYAGRFVQNRGLIPNEKTLELLLLSALMSTKFWMDTGIDSDLAAHAMSLPLKEFFAKEWDFVRCLDYKLCISEVDITKLFSVEVKSPSIPSAP